MKRFAWLMVLMAVFMAIGCGVTLETKWQPNEIKVEQGKSVLETLGFTTWLDNKQLVAMNKQFPDVQISANIKDISDKDRKFLRWAIKSADVLHRIFLGQSSADGLGILSAFESARAFGPLRLSEQESLLYRLASMNCGRYSRLDGGMAFMGRVPGEKKSETAMFYPMDMTKDEFQNWINAHPNDKAAFESSFTIIRRSGLSLVAIPYSEFYQQDLTLAADYLRKAAQFADSDSMADFLFKRANAFGTNDYKPSDEAWVRVDGSRFEVVFGPYEVYEDELMNLKASFEAYITLVDPELSAELSKVKAFLPGMEEALPLDSQYRGYKRAKGSPVFAVDLIYTAGDARKHIQTSAFALPNDEDVRQRVGTKKVMLRNVQKAKFGLSLVPISMVVLVDSQQALVTWQEYFWHNLLHELAHGMGPGKIILNGVETTVSNALKELYSTIEECKADVMGFWEVPYLIKVGHFQPDSLEKTAATSLAGFFRSVRFGINEAHGGANILIYNYLKVAGVYVYDQTNGRFRADETKFLSAVTALARELLTIEATGDYNAAKAFIKKYGEVPEEVRVMVQKLNDAGIPTDIHPVYATADELMAQ